MNRHAPLPLDIRLMNMLATTMFVAAVLLALGAALAWTVRLPLFAIQGVTVTGDVSHYNAITLRANVVPRLQGTYFTLDVQSARKAFETMPWVRQALVRRDFPNRIKVQLQEHQAVAFWGPEGDMRLVNSFGEVFEANVGELDQEYMPRLTGPDGYSAQMLEMYRLLQPMYASRDLNIEQLERTARGGWRAKLESGTALELGSASAADMLARSEGFLKTMTEVTARYGRTPVQLQSVDLRHSDGYAIRLDGVRTLVDDIKKQ